MLPPKIPPQLILPGQLAVALFDAAALSARTIARLSTQASARKSIGNTLRPGPGTPLWNELVKQAQPFLTKRGEKAKLARFLGLPRQRLHECLKARRACPDAERALLLLCWTARRQQGLSL